MKKNILFDLDGTLTDSREGIIKSFAYAFERLGVACPDESRLELCIGPPLRDSFTEILKSEDEHIINRAVEFYRQRFSTKGLYENQPYDGITDLLGQLKVNGHNLYVATSKAKYFADIIVDHFDLSPFFHAVYGSELDGSTTNKTKLLHGLLEQEGLNPTDTLMVGDRKYDVIAAVNNQLEAVGVLWGYGSHRELTTAKANYLIDNPSDMLTLQPSDENTLQQSSPR